MYLLGKYHESFHRTIPYRLITVPKGEPGEDAMGIGKEQPVNRQVATNGKHSVRITDMRIGEP
jgi:hypothetical protein